MTSLKKQSTEAAVREIRRRTRRKFAPEEKIRIVLEGLRGEQSVSELCRDCRLSISLLQRQIRSLPLPSFNARFARTSCQRSASSLC